MLSTIYDRLTSHIACLMLRVMVMLNFYCKQSTRGCLLILLMSQVSQGSEGPSDSHHVPHLTRPSVEQEIRF